MNDERLTRWRCKDCGQTLGIAKANGWFCVKERNVPQGSKETSRFGRHCGTMNAWPQQKLANSMREAGVSLPVA